MFSWIELALLFLKLANAIMSQVNDARSFKAGADAEIAKISQEILRKTEAGKKIMEQVDAMSDAEVDDALRGLEPSDVPVVRPPSGR